MGKVDIRNKEKRIAHKMDTKKRKKKSMKISRIQFVYLIPTPKVVQWRYWHIVNRSQPFIIHNGDQKFRALSRSRGYGYREGLWL